MGVRKFSNNASSLLAVAINTTDTSITITTGDGNAKFPTITGTDYADLTLKDASGNFERVKATARSGDTFTVTRGQDGTTAKSFAIGDSISLRWSKSTAEDTLFKSENLAGLASTATSQTNLGITAAAQTILDDASVADIRTTLSVYSQAESNTNFINTTGDTMTGALEWDAEESVASATTTDIGAATSNNVLITGTTTITGLGTKAAGATRNLRFNGALTLTHNATSLILPAAGANITTQAGDTATALSLGSGNWVVTDYQRSTQAPIASNTWRIYGLSGKQNSGSPTTQYDLTAEAVVLKKASGVGEIYVDAPGTLTNNISTAGPAANGRDQAGAFSAAAWIHFYYIHNGTTLATISSTTAPPTGPTLPSGYTHWAYAGAHRLSAISQLQDLYIAGNWEYWRAAPQTLVVSSTSETTVTVTFIPTNAVSALMMMSSSAVTSGTNDVDITMKLGFITGNYIWQAQYRYDQLAASTTVNFGRVSQVFPIITAQTLYADIDVTTGSSPSLVLLPAGFSVNNHAL